MDFKNRSHIDKLKTAPSPSKARTPIPINTSTLVTPTLLPRGRTY